MSSSVSSFPYDAVYSSSENIRKSLVKVAKSKSKFAEAVQGLVVRLDGIVKRVSDIRRNEDMLVTDIKDNPALETMKSLDGRIKEFNDGLDSICKDFKTLHRDVTIVLECIQEENRGYE